MKKITEILALLGILTIVGAVIWHFVSCGGNPFIIKNLPASHIVILGNTLILMAMYLKQSRQ